MSTDSEQIIFTKLDELKDGIHQINLRLARMEDHGPRITVLEGQVRELQLAKAKLLGIVAVVSFVVPIVVSLIAKLM